MSYEATVEELWRAKNDQLKEAAKTNNQTMVLLFAFEQSRNAGNPNHQNIPVGQKIRDAFTK